MSLIRCKSIGSAVLSARIGPGIAVARTSGACTTRCTARAASTSADGGRWHRQPHSRNTPTVVSGSQLYAVDSSAGTGRWHGGRASALAGGATWAAPGASRGVWGRRGARYMSGDTTTVDIQGHSEHLFQDVIVPLNERMMGPLDHSATQITPMPMVFVLGNHSSGKSSFLNYVIGRDVQTEGLAPTDDGFTVIAPGHEDVDQDGPAMIGDPDLGYAGLRAFGTNLINHVTLKVRRDMQVENIMLVDSPGMIDSPVHTDSFEDAAAASSRDRGYDFPGVIQWFSERADVILLFFDPDKPGTTGETLACMTKSLSGMEHKVHIILNKVDQFSKMHDFARAYGSLCWNLSKVIPRKDLPKIYTMCIPGHATANSLQPALPDLEVARNQIVDAVNMAPLRRVDNSITRLYNSARLLQLHLTMMDSIRKEYRSAWLQWTGLTAAGLAGGMAVAGGILMTGLVEVAAPVFGISVLGAAGAYYLGQRRLRALSQHMFSSEGLDAAFRARHMVSIAQKDEFIVSLWDRVKPQLQVALRTMGPRGLPKVTSSDFSALDKLVSREVPQLRKAATKAGSIQFNRAFSERLVASDSS